MNREPQTSAERPDEKGSLPTPIGAKGQGLRTGLATLGASVADLFFPRACAVCEVLGEDEDDGLGVCRTCLGDCFPPLGSVCQKCGAPVPVGNEAEQCARCTAPRLHFSWARGLGIYRGPLMDWILRTKRPAGQRLAISAGRLMGQTYGEMVRRERIDLVAPIPMPWLRRVWMGINGPDLMAEAVCDAVRLPLAMHLLRMRGLPQRQAALSPAARHRNVRGVFGVSPSYDITGARVLLVDDVLTTGATASEAARVLIEAGAAAVGVLVAARAIGEHT